MYSSRVAITLQYMRMVKMVFLKEKYNSWTGNPHNGEILFFIGFIMFLFRSVMFTTMFPVTGTALKACFGISILLMLAKIFFFDIYSFEMLITVLAMFSCGIMVMLSSGYYIPFVWMVVLVAAKNISFRKILQVYLLMNLTIMGMAFLASLLGIIENLAYTTSDLDAMRYSFGCVYTTDFAAHIFFMLLTAFYLYYEHLRWYHYLGTCIIDILVYYFCYAKLDSICILLLVVFFGIYHIIRWQSQREQEAYTSTGVSKTLLDKMPVFKRTKGYYRYKKFCAITAPVSMPLLAIVMYYMTISYKADNETLVAINDAITGRLNLGYAGLKNYGISLFGQDVPMVGMGGSTEFPEDYFFVDCSYLFALLRYGILFLCMVFIIYGVICYKNREDTALMLAIILLAISSSIDHHLLEEAYNPFFYALFASNMAKQEIEQKGMYVSAYYKRYNSKIEILREKL